MRLLVLWLCVLMHSEALRRVPIDRRSNLSMEEFEESYASRGRPVIITDSINDWPAVRWGKSGVDAARRALRDKCGHRRLVSPCDLSDGGSLDDVETQVKMPPASGDWRRHWAGLQDVPANHVPANLGELMEWQETRKDHGKEIQLHDHPLDRLCPSLLMDGDVRVPKYFPEDFSEQLPVPHLQVRIPPWIS